MNQQEKDLNAGTLVVIKASTNILDKVATVLTALCQKRVTLEEKMIRRQLHDISIVTAKILTRLHTLLRDGGAAAMQEAVIELEGLNAEIDDQVSELLKIVDYDLNFLEQYFEHAFVERLINECRFVERLEAALDKL